MSTGVAGRCTVISRWLVTGSNDTSARLWNLRLGELVDLACRTGERNLTLEEWKTYVGEAARYQCTCQDLAPGAGAPPDACEESIDG